MQRKSNQNYCDFFPDPSRRKNPSCSTWSGQLLRFWLLALVLGCSSQPSTPKVERDSVELTVACPEASQIIGVLAGHGQAWAAQQGVRLKVVRYDAQAGPSSAGPATDVWLLSPAELPRWAAAGRLLPLPAEQDNSDAWRKLLPIYRHKLLVWDQVAYAQPIVGESWLCFFRDDLLRDKDHRAAFNEKHGRELTAPATWEEFADLAAFFRDRPWRDGDRAASLPPLPASEEGLDRDFYTIAAPFCRYSVREEERSKVEPRELFSFHDDLSTGQPRLDAPGFVQALRLLRQLQACRPAEAVREPAEVFREGKAVLCLAEAGWLSRFQESGSKVRDRIGVCRVPGAATVFDFRTGAPRAIPQGNYIPYLGAGGWLGVVPRGSAHPEQAFALLADLASPRTSSEIVSEPTWGGGPFRQEHLKVLADGNALGWGSKHANVLAEALKQSLNPAAINPVLRLRTPDERKYMKALVEELRGFLSNPDADPRQALAKVARLWRSMDERIGVEKHLAEYRLSLSLPAKP